MNTFMLHDLHGDQAFEAEINRRAKAYAGALDALPAADMAAGDMLATLDRAVEELTAQLALVDAQMGRKSAMGEVLREALREAKARRAAHVKREAEEQKALTKAANDTAAKDQNGFVTHDLNAAKPAFQFGWMEALALSMHGISTARAFAPQRF